MVSGETVVEGAHNGHGAHAEEQAGSNEPLCHGGLAALVDKPLGLLLDPVAQGAHPPVQVQQFSHNGADDHGENGSDGVFSLHAAGDADEQYAQRRGAVDDRLEPEAQVAAAGQEIGKTGGKCGNQHAHGGAHKNGQGIDNGAGEHVKHVLSQ